MPRIGGRFLGVRVSYKGKVRGYAGPKSARVHFGGGRSRSVTSSVGPFTHSWTSGSRRTYGPSQQELQRNQARQAVITLHNEGYSISQIADALNAYGAPTSSGRGIWRSSGVSRILSNAGYTPRR